jgi:predicted Rossmann fold flavoprotein
MFPASNRSQSVVDALLEKLESLNVKVFTNSPVKDIFYENGETAAIELKNGNRITTKAIVVAVGGKSVPHTGSTGDGYAWAEKAGHTITELFPTEVPITSNEPFIQAKTLQGLSLRDINLSVLNPKGKPLISHRMDMIFTHFGISGPAVLRCSQFVIKAMKKWNLSEVVMSLDVLPDRTEEEIFQEIVKDVKTDSKKSIKNILKGFLPERYLLFLLEQAEIDQNMQGGTISNEKIRVFAKLSKSFTFRVNGTLPLEKAFVTGGGVSVKEIEPQTMASKKMNGLYFCGELLDIHGYTGGYNITAALVTGRLAGTNAAQYSKKIKKMIGHDL